MQLLLELLPLGAFLAVYLQTRNIYTATIVLMAGMVLSLAILWARQKRLPGIFGISTALVVVFGAATLLLRNPKFIQWKPTILLWLVAAAFLVSRYAGKQTLAQRMLQSALGGIELARQDWIRLNWAWILYALITGGANIAVAYHTSEDTWVKVKIPLLMGSMFVFMIGQTLWLQLTGRLKS